MFRDLGIRTLLFIVMILLQLSILYVLQYFNIDPLPIPRPMGNMSRKRHNQKTIYFAEEYLHRKEMVIKTCRRKHIIDSYKFGFERSKEILYIPSSKNVTYCKVPKAGSTLISHLFFLMTGKSHGNVHLAGSARFGKGWIRARTVKTGMKFLVARDPFSRLFSAYINKYLLMEHRRQLNSMQQRYKRDMFSIGGEVCGYNLTFQDFLDFSLDVAFNTQRRIDRHWAPVYLLCHPCEMNYDVIAKQETLSQDLKFIIEHVNLSISAKRVLSERVEVENYCKRMEHIMKHVFHRNSNCPSVDAYLYRVWTSFKTQGYIRAEVKFPFLEIIKDKHVASTFDMLCRILQNITEKYPISTEEKEIQRHKFLVDAYANIKKETIQKIQRLYQLDFELFGYSNKPPT